jgi:uncharacterized protein (DUF1697 family)
VITYVSLFRGINVGGNRKVAMKDLKEMHEALGFGDVVHYIQSGNVVFTSDDTNVQDIQQRIERSFEQKFGFATAGIVRNSNELDEIIEKNPFRNQPDRESKWIVVMFLATHADPMAEEALHKVYTGPEEIFVLGQEVYIYYPGGIGNSKLTNSFLEKKLKTVGTARNLNTVLKLQEMMQVNK